MANETNRRIETELEVTEYIRDLKYALNNGASITLQVERQVDRKRNIKHTNQYTINTLFPDEDPVKAIKRELLTLSKENYMGTVKDLRHPQNSEMREFGKVINETDDVYIKIRVELLGQYGNPTTFVMSFHFAEIAFTADMFPYKK